MRLTVPRPMNRYGSDPAPNRLTTSVSTPISPKPRPSSRAAKSAATRSTVRPSPGRIPIARPQRVIPGAVRRASAPSCPSSHPASPRGYSTPVARMGDTTRNDRRVTPRSDQATRRSSERGQGNDAPARRERRRGHDRQMAQAARRPRRQVRAPARGHHRQGQRRGPLAVRGHPDGDPRPGGRDRPQRGRDRGHRHRRRGDRPGGARAGRHLRAGGAGEAVVRARRRPGRLR